MKLPPDASEDQSNCQPGYYRRNNGMMVQIPDDKPAGETKFKPNLSDDDLRLLAREKLSEALQAIDPRQCPELTRKLCAEVKDRLDGRPVQAVDLTQKIGIVQIVLEASKQRQNMTQLGVDSVITPMVIDN